MASGPGRTPGPFCFTAVWFYITVFRTVNEPVQGLYDVSQGWNRHRLLILGIVANLLLILPVRETNAPMSPRRKNHNKNEH